MALCPDCNRSVLRITMVDKRCSECYSKAVLKEEAAREEKQRAKAEHEAQLAQDLQARTSSIVLTTETAHDLPVAERLGIVAAEVVIGMHIFRDIGAAFRDVFGGRSQTMQRGLKEAREAALAELRLEAAQLGADAVVAIDLDYSEISGGGKSMLFLVASGTAVRLVS